jgi:Uma2 family endonuclease
MGVTNNSFAFLYLKNYICTKAKKMEVATLPIQSDYEIERGKPMPSLLHAVVQMRLIMYLGNHYEKEFNLFPELALDTPGQKSTPDIAIDEYGPIDFSRDVIKKPTPPLATIEILSPTQVLQTLLDKTNEYFSFGVKSCWVAIPPLKSIYVFKAPNDYQVFSHEDILRDPNLNIEVPLGVIFAS